MQSACWAPLQQPAPALCLPHCQRGFHEGDANSATAASAAVPQLGSKPAGGGGGSARAAGESAGAAGALWGHGPWAMGCGAICGVCCCCGPCIHYSLLSALNLGQGSGGLHVHTWHFKQRLRFAACRSSTTGCHARPASPRSVMCQEMHISHSSKHSITREAARCLKEAGIHPWA